MSFNCPGLHLCAVLSTGVRGPCLSSWPS
ncbi:rCG36141 [Rattus norvegicus]|uniref:RCG36141 n=1 Tax=Rattus norvegicus TaxID=10116 RepID=A6IKP9_RAT|nr:rCG36141 [Rattus norvegicus]